MALHVTPMALRSPTTTTRAKRPNGATWMSGTDVKIDAHYCVTSDNGNVKKCAADTLTVQPLPQNVRQICGTPTCGSQ
jgi:hypothetical protein